MGVLSLRHRSLPSSTSVHHQARGRSAQASHRATVHLFSGGKPRSVATSAASTFASVDEESDTEGGMMRYMLKSGFMDYYEVLQVDDDASPEEVKRAYRALAKECHPDYLGDRGHNLCIILNEAYETLSDPTERNKYNSKLEQALKDDSDAYTGKPLSKWMPSVNPAMAKNEDPAESRAVFVDEFSCIGCKNCIWYAPATFRIEEEYGRSRVYAQWLDKEELLQTAIDSCPVSCIHWVQRQDLPPLEYVSQKKVTERTNVANMMAGQGGYVDAFSATEQFLKERKRLEEKQEIARKARPYSPAQEAARRAATAELRRTQVGWFSGFEAFFASAAEHMNMAVSGVDDKFAQVGQRKRAVRWDKTSRQKVANPPLPGYTVPLERALVLSSSEDD